MRRTCETAIRAALTLAVAAAVPTLSVAADEDAFTARMQDANVARNNADVQRAYLSEGGDLQRQASGPRIISGERVDQRATNWAWIVSIRLDGDHWCGGSLVSPVITTGRAVSGWRNDDVKPRWVVTAAHCLFDRDGNPLGEDRLEVGFGNVSILKQQSVKVAAKFVHSEFDKSTLTNDIAVLRLDQPAQASGENVVTSVRVPNVQEQVWLYRRYAALTVYGWGRTADSFQSTMLQEVRLPLVTPDDCDRAFEDVGLVGQIRPGVTCAGYVTGSFDSCNGDSGGSAAFVPMHVRDDPIQDPVLVGVVSWGRGCALPGVFGVYTNVLAYRQWLESVVSKNS